MSSSGWPVERTQRITISAEEGQSRVATIEYASTGGENLADMVGNQVIYDYQSDSGSGILFTGYIDSAQYNPAKNTITLKCSDGLKKIIDGLSNQQIEDLMPSAYFHKALFRERAEGFDYAQQLLKSAQGTLDISPTGTPRFTPWTVTNSVDFSGGVFSGSLSAGAGGTSSVINKVTLNVSHRYSLKRARRTRYLFQRDQCEIIMGDRHTLVYEMLSDAIDKVDARCIGFHAKMIGTGNYTCDNNTILVLAAFHQRVNDTGHVLEKRWYQSVTETFQITVQSSSSIAKYGDKTSTLSCGLEHKRADDSWTEQQPGIDVEAIGPEPGATTHPDIKKGLMPGVESDFVDNVGWSQYLGDYAEIDVSEDNYNDINQAITTGVAIAQATIKRSHRTSRVSFETVINPFADLTHRGTITLPEGVASGKIGNIEYTIDFVNARATQRTTLYLFDGLSGVDNPALPVDIPGDSEYPVEVGATYDIAAAFTENLGWPLPDTFSGLGYETTADDIETKMAYQIHLPAISDDLTANVDFDRPDAAQTLSCGGDDDTLTVGISDV